MARTRFPAALLVGAALVLAPAASAGVFSWTNPAGGDWDDPANWDASGYPNLFFDFADFGLAGDYTVLATDPAGVAAVAGIQVRGGTVRLHAHDGLQALTVVGGFGAPARLCLEGGALVGSGSHVAAADGTFHLDGGRLAGTSSAATLRIDSGGTLSGSGGVDGGLVNYGLVSPGDAAAGLLAMDATGWNQAATGRLELDVDGSGADRVVTPGPVSLAGVLAVRVDPLDPPADGEYLLLEWGSVAGAFDAVELPGDGSRTYSLADGPDGLRLTVETAAAAAVHELDVLPGSCRNPMSTRRKGSLPVALVGAGDAGFDAAGLLLAGVAPTHWGVEDVTGPRGEGDPCATCPSGPDGVADLVLHYPAEAVRDALGDPGRGETVELLLTGTGPDGSPVEASDCVTLVGGGKPPRAGAASAGPALRATSRPDDALQTVSFSMQQSERAELGVFDVTGRRLASFGPRVWSAGDHEVQWDASRRSSGMVFYRLATASGTWTAKQVILR